MRSNGVGGFFLLVCFLAGPLEAQPLFLAEQRAFERDMSRLQDLLSQLEADLLRLADETLALEPAVSIARTMIGNAVERADSLRRWAKNNASHPSTELANALTVETAGFFVKDLYLSEKPTEELSPPSLRTRIRNGALGVALSAKLFEPLQDDPLIGPKGGLLRILLWSLGDYLEWLLNQEPGEEPRVCAARVIFEEIIVIDDTDPTLDDRWVIGATIFPQMPPMTAPGMQVMLVNAVVGNQGQRLLANPFQFGPTALGPKDQPHNILITVNVRELDENENRGVDDTQVIGQLFELRGLRCPSDVLYKFKESVVDSGGNTDAGNLESGAVEFSIRVILEC